MNIYMKKNNFYQIVAIVSMTVFVALGVFFGISKMIEGNIQRGFLGFSSILFLVIPPFMKSIKINHPYNLYTLIFTFMIMAYDFGCVNEGFDKIPYFDKVSHFISGIVFAILGYCIYFFITKNDGVLLKSQWILPSIFGIFFSAFVAVVWEIGEFIGYLATGHDSQHNLTTGVFDTMEDMIVCLIGSSISLVFFVIYAKKGKKLLTGWVVEDFIEKSSVKQVL